jgi:hypothetical protein
VTADWIHWVTHTHGSARPQVVDGEDRVNTPIRGGPSACEFGMGLTIRYHKITGLLRNV